jgi:hypothetical protein
VYLDNDLVNKNDKPMISQNERENIIDDLRKNLTELNNLKET